MNEWLDLMLEEIDRKKREAEEAKDESAYRSGECNQSEQGTKKKTKNFRHDRP